MGSYVIETQKITMKVTQDKPNQLKTNKIKHFWTTENFILRINNEIRVLINSRRLFKTYKK